MVSKSKCINKNKEVFFVEFIGCTGDPGKGCFNVAVGTEVKPGMNRDTNERGGNRALRETALLHEFPIVRMSATWQGR